MDSNEYVLYLVQEVIKLRLDRDSIWNENERTIPILEQPCPFFFMIGFRGLSTTNENPQPRDRNFVQAHLWRSPRLGNWRIDMLRLGVFIVKAE
jgi:hypothetical protein